MCAAMRIETDGSSPQSAAPRRRFQLADAMILVAATAMGLGVIQAIARAAKRSPYDWFAELIGQAPPFDQAAWYDPVAGSERVIVLALLTMPLVAMVTLALVPIRLLGTRPRFRRLARQPGLMASCASGLAMAFIALPVLVGALAGGVSWAGLSRMLGDDSGILSATMYGGLAVLVSWMTLFLGGRWRAEASWIDRLGRALGLYWIVAASTVWAALFFVDIFTTHCWSGIHFPTLPTAVGRTILHLATITVPLLAMVTVVLLPVQLVGTRPCFRRLARQPGLMASCASGLAIVLVGLQVVVMVLVVAAFADDGEIWEEISEIPAWLLDEERVTCVASCGGLAVLVSWTTLLIGRQWRVERSWVDRLGRLIGLCWILAAFAVVSGGALIQADYERYVELRLGSSPPAASNAGASGR